MRRLLLWCMVASSTVASAPAIAQGVASTSVASNGVQVDVYSDDFANRYEYSAPVVKIEDGFLLVATVKKGGVAPDPHITGTMMYSGDWRRYETALFRGGEVAKFTSTGRNVGRCSSSRYSRPSCSLNEGFRVDISAEDIKKHAQNGILAIQLRAQDTSTAIFEIPVSYFEAVKEVSKK